MKWELQFYPIYIKTSLTKVLKLLESLSQNVSDSEPVELSDVSRYLPIAKPKSYMY